MFSHHVEGYVLMFSRLLGGIIGIEYMPRSVTGDQGYLGESDGIDARQGRELFFDRTVEWAAFCIGIFRLRQLQIKEQKMIRVKSQMRVVEIDQGPHKEPGARQQKHRQRHLNDDESPACEVPVAPRRRLLAVFQS